MTTSREELIAHRTKLEAEIATAHEHYESFRIIALNRKEISRLNELIAECDKEEKGKVPS